MFQRHLLNVHAQNKYLRPTGTLFMLKWLPSLISNRSESFILVQQQ